MQRRSRDNQALSKNQTILFVGHSPDRYAPVWRRLAKQNMNLLFAKTPSQAKRRASGIPVNTVVVDDHASNGSPLQTCRQMRSLAPAAAIVLIAEDQPGPSWLYDHHVPSPRFAESIDDRQWPSVALCGEALIGVY